MFNSTKNCSIFKNHFLSLAQHLVSTLPLSPNIFTDSKIASYYGNNGVLKDLTFQLLETSADIDNLSGKFLKDGAQILTWPIPQLYNLSINFNSFPGSCKIAKVKPFFKKGSKTDPQNYHPISLLPLLSKIIERIVHDQIEDFLSKNKILYRFQSRFRKNYSPNTYFLGHLTDKITTRFEKVLFTDHQILLKKMKYLGFSKNAIAWFKILSLWTEI